MGKNDIRFTAELQGATRKYINKLVAIADKYGEDRDEVVPREVAALSLAIKGMSFKAFDVESDEFFE